MTGEVQCSLPSNVSSVTAVCFSGLRVYAATGNTDSMLQTYNTASGEYLSEFDVNNGPITVLTYTPNAKTILCGTVSGIVHVYDVRENYVKTKLRVDEGYHISSIALSPVSKEVIVGSGSGALCIYNYINNQLIYNFPSLNAVVTTIAIGQSSLEQCVFVCTLPK